MASGGEDLSEQTPDFLCNTCKQDNDVNVSAVDYCRACCEYFCEGCLTYHNQKVSTKDHQGELLGKDILKNMSSTRLMQASAVPHSSDDVLFCCHNCYNAGSLRTAVDYCRQCSEYMCDVCLAGHNQWTKHEDKLLGKKDMKQMIRAQNLSRRRPYDKTLATGHDNTRQTENYCRLAVLIVKGCTRIMRALFLRHVESSTPAGHLHPPWTVDEFLLANKTDICKRLGKEKGMLPGIKENILFPSHGATNLEKWDLVLLSFMLLDVCNYKEQQPLAMYLKKMKIIRNSICHRGDASVTNDDFDLHFDQIKTCIEKCSTFLADKAIADEMNALVHNVEHSSLSLDESSRLLREWYNSDKHIEERLEQHSIALRGVDTKVDAVESKVDAVDSKVELLTSRLELLCGLFSKSGQKVDMPDTNIDILMKNSGLEQERLLSEKLVQMIDPKLRKDPALKSILSDPSYPIIYQYVQEAMMNLLSNHRELSDVSHKCVTIRCSNFASFKDLLHQSTTGGLTELFKPVERAIRDIEGYEHVELEVTISDREYWRVMDELVTNLLTASGLTKDDLAAERRRIADEPERETDDSAIDEVIKDVSILSSAEYEERFGTKHDGTCILINIKPRSIGHYIHIMEMSRSESMKVALQNLSNVLKDYYHLEDLSIEARPVEIRPSLPEPVEIRPSLPEPVEIRPSLSDPVEIRPSLPVAGHGYLESEAELSELEEGPKRIGQLKSSEEKTDIKDLKPTVEQQMSEPAFSKEVERPEYTTASSQLPKDYTNLPTSEQTDRFQQASDRELRSISPVDEGDPDSQLDSGRIIRKSHETGS